MTVIIRRLISTIVMVFLCSTPASADSDKSLPSKEIVRRAKAVAEMACEARRREKRDQIPVVVLNGVTYIGSCIARSRSSEVYTVSSVSVPWDDFTNSCKDSPDHPVYYAGRCWPASFKVDRTTCPGFDLVMGWRIYLMHGEWRTVLMSKCPKSME